MTIYYSPSTAGFYDTGVVEYPTLPEDCIEITQEERDLYIEEINHKNNQLVVEDEKLVLKWAAYRQQLRDIPQMFVNPEDVDWPFVPNN